MSATITTPRFDFDYLGVRAYLLTDQRLDEHLKGLAIQVYDAARRLAPVGTGPRDRHPGEYRDSLYIAKHLSKSRMSYHVGSSSKKAWWIEYGTAHMAKYAVLRRALDSATGGARDAASYPGIAEYDTQHAGTQRKREIGRAYRARLTGFRAARGT